MAFSGEKLRQIRLQQGRSQRDMPVAHDTVSAIESGRRNPHPSTLRKLAEALGVEVRDFFEEPAVFRPAPPVDFDLERMIEELEEAEKPKDLAELRELIEERAVPELAKLPKETLEAIEAEKRSKSSQLDKRFNSPDMKDPAKDAEMLKLLEEIRAVRLALYALDRVLTEA